MEALLPSTEMVGSGRTTHTQPQGQSDSLPLLMSLQGYLILPDRKLCWLDELEFFCGFKMCMTISSKEGKPCLSVSTNLPRSQQVHRGAGVALQAARVSTQAALVKAMVPLPLGPWESAAAASGSEGPLALYLDPYLDQVWALPVASSGLRVNLKLSGSLRCHL